MALTKAKLIEQLDNGDYDDHLPAGGSMTDEEILDAVKRVDGAGSGLDADKLDGEEGSYYLPASSYTAGDILNKLKTVDGAGSGLDADVLQGYSATRYNRVMGSQVTSVSSKVFSMASYGYGVYLVTATRVNATSRDDCGTFVVYYPGAGYGFVRAIDKGTNVSCTINTSTNEVTVTMANTGRVWITKLTAAETY